MPTPEDPAQFMLLELERLLENGPLHISNEQVADIGAQKGLTESQSYRLFNRLDRTGRIIGEPKPVDREPGWIAYWLEDIQL